MKEIKQELNGFFMTTLEELRKIAEQKDIPVEDVISVFTSMWCDCSDSLSNPGYYPLLSVLIKEQDGEGNMLFKHNLDVSEPELKIKLILSLSEALGVPIIESINLLQAQENKLS